MLMDTNPWLLALTAVVTILHSVFDMLAFKNGMVALCAYVCFQVAPQTAHQYEH